MTITTRRRVAVFGPAYLDRVLRVDRPLIDPALGPPLDQSVDGEWKFGTNPTLELVDPADYTLEIDPAGRLARADRQSSPGTPDSRRRHTAGELCAVWPGRMIWAGWEPATPPHCTGRCGAHWARNRTRRARRSHGDWPRLALIHQPIRVPGRSADWTLLISSGEFGDKLPIGFRGCHAALTPESLDAVAQRPCDLRVVASLPNHLAARVLRAPGAAVRFFAPTMRNMLDRDCPISSFAASIDILSCNRREWETLEDREEVAWQVSILVVTDGPDGSVVRFTTTDGRAGTVAHPGVPARSPTARHQPGR